MRTLLGDPLVHFLVLGAIVFALFRSFGDDGAEAQVEASEIVVTPGRIEALSDQFEKVWLRPITESELDGLIQDYVREEILYREATAMGLDRDDTIVRRRMRQKMEFLFEDVASPPVASDEELEAFLSAHPERFRREGRVMFQHIFVNPEVRGESAQAEASLLLEQLRVGDIQPDAAGDPLLVPHRFDNEPDSAVERLLGGQFLARVVELETGAWHGPVQSGLGLHLVKLEQRTPASTPGLAEVREAVTNEWVASKRQEANDALYERIRQNYTVTISPHAVPASP